MLVQGLMMLIMSGCYGTHTCPDLPVSELSDISGGALPCPIQKTLSDAFLLATLTHTNVHPEASSHGRTLVYSSCGQEGQLVVSLTNGSI